MWTIIAPFVTWMAGIAIGYGWFHVRSQKWADTAFLRRRLDEYRRNMVALKADHETVATSLERYRIRSEVLDEMLESEAETLYLLTGKKADMMWERNSRISGLVEQKITEARVEEAVIKDSTAVAMGHEPLRWKQLMNGGPDRP